MNYNNLFPLFAFAGIETSLLRTHACYVVLMFPQWSCGQLNPKDFRKLRSSCSSSWWVPAHENLQTLPETKLMKHFMKAAVPTYLSSPLPSDHSKLFVFLEQVVHWVHNLLRSEKNLSSQHGVGKFYHKRIRLKTRRDSVNSNCVYICPPNRLYIVVHKIRTWQGSFPKSEPTRRN